MNNRLPVDEQEIGRNRWIMHNEPNCICLSADYPLPFDDEIDEPIEIEKPEMQRIEGQLE